MREEETSGKPDAWPSRGAHITVHRASRIPARSSGLAIIQSTATWLAGTGKHTSTFKYSFHKRLISMSHVCPATLLASPAFAVDTAVNRNHLLGVSL